MIKRKLHFRLPEAELPSGIGLAPRLAPINGKSSD